MYVCKVATSKCPLVSLLLLLLLQITFQWLVYLFFLTGDQLYVVSLV